MRRRMKVSRRRNRKASSAKREIVAAVDKAMDLLDAVTSKYPYGSGGSAQQDEAIDLMDAALQKLNQAYDQARRIR